MTYSARIVALRQTNTPASFLRNLPKTWAARCGLAFHFHLVLVQQVPLRRGNALAVDATPPWGLGTPVKLHLKRTSNVCVTLPTV